MKIKEFRFKGNHQFSSRTLHGVIARHEGGQFTSEELDRIREEITLFYVNHGFINSGAILEDQDLDQGIITFTIIEGRLAEIRLEGNHWFRSWWIRNQIRRAAGKPLNYNKLREQLQILRQLPTVTKINADLAPGKDPGDGVLNLSLKDSQPFRAGLEFNNRRPPSVGGEGLEIHLADLNLTGHNDPFNLSYTVLHSRQNGVDWSGANNFNLSYSVPVTPWNTTLILQGGKCDSTVLEGPFSDLNITSRFSTYSISLRQPIYSTPTQELALSISAAKSESRSFLLDQPFSLSPGSDNGEIKDTVLRGTLEMTDRSPQHVFGFRSTFVWGVDALGATMSDPSRDGRFFSWLGQAQYVRRLFGTDNLLMLRVNAQLTNDQLFSFEQYAIGGMDSVRGYRERELLRDNGVFASLELRIPIWRTHEKRALLQLAPFFDLASGWNHRPSQPAISADYSQDTLPSAGIGLLASPCQHFNIEFYWGYAFNREFVHTSGNNLQDYGLHFAVRMDAF